MIKKRPVNLSLPSISFPVTAIISILHRLSGILLFISLPFLLWGLNVSLTSPEGFDQMAHLLSGVWARLAGWIVMVGLFGHTIAGIRHLLMDIGIGETRAGGRLAAWIVAGLTLLFALAAGIWLW